MRRSKKPINPDHYIGYVGDDVPVENIMQMFQQFDERVKDSSSMEDAARKVFIENADPAKLPLEVWFSLENFQDSGEFREEDYEPDFFDDDEEIPRTLKSQRRRSVGGQSDGPNLAITSLGAVEQLGGGIELWPQHKLRILDDSADSSIIHEEFPNVIYAQTAEEFQELCKVCPIHLVDRIDFRSIVDIAGSDIDAILMDPPLGQCGWTMSRLQELLLDLKKRIEQLFILMWVSPEHLVGVNDVCRRTELVFCDSVAVELLDSELKPAYTKLSNGFKRHTRMLVMYRTLDINRSDIAQQRIKDTGWGLSIPNGKSLSRASMPSVAHQIIETMLPAHKQHGKLVPRKFVELWPSYFHRRKGWIYIEETEGME